MEIRQLRYFLEIARTEHLTQAARSLFVTQSTVSHSLRLLEEGLGVRLFDRVGRGLRLSQAGAAFRAYAGRALQEIEAGRMALTELEGIRAGTLTVGVIPTFLNTLVPATVAAFSAAYPKVRVIVRDLRAGAIEELLVAGELDVGVAFHPTERDEIETEPLFDERMMLVVAPHHRLANRRSIAVKALAKLPLALLPRSFATRRLIDDAFRKARVVPSIHVEMESVEALIAVCRTGVLASIVGERAARQSPGLRSIPLVSPQAVRRAGVLWRRGGSHSPAAREFVALLKPAARGPGSAR